MVPHPWMEPKNQTAPLRNKIYNKKDFSKQYRMLFTRKNSCNNWRELNKKEIDINFLWNMLGYFDVVCKTGYFVVV